MSDDSPNGGDERQRGESLELYFSDLAPEDALRGFMEVDPEKVKGRLEKGEEEEK